MYKNAIVVMAVGARYQKILKRRKSDLEHYARKCGAILIVLSEPLDRSLNARGMLDQKLLIPSVFKEFDLVAFLDLDTLISSEAPSIFTQCNDAGFHAVPTLYDDKHKKLCERYFGIIPQNSSLYFSDRGKFDGDGFYSINGGVWVCRPAVVGAYLKDAYIKLNENFSYHEPCADELTFAYETQIRNDLSILDQRFNYKIIYDIYGVDKFYNEIGKRKRFKIYRKLESCFPNITLKYPRNYVNLITSTLSKNWIVHFAGRCPYLNY
ncbi:hypothetical protein OAY88_01570 [Alphaproteobacteria bacterium]|nr:hypothetical protein [Alphaproteobacteria bacterium]